MTEEEITDEEVKEILNKLNVTLIGLDGEIVLKIFLSGILSLAEQSKFPKDLIDLSILVLNSKKNEFKND